MAAKDEQLTSHEDPDSGLPRDPDDTELETLSLCDLPLYSDEYEYDLLGDDAAHRHGSSSPKIDHDDPFEFSSEDLSGSGRKMCPAENIIFCGRLIPYDPPVMAASAGGSAEPRGKIGGNQMTKKKKKRRFFKWRLSLFSRHRNPSSNYRNLKFDDRTGSKNRYLPTGLECLPLEKCRYVPVPEKCTDRHSFSTGRLTSHSGRVKCRWYVLMFRSARFPVGMELQDMKTRQSRRNLSPMFGSSDADVVAGDGKCSEKGNRNWGLWRLLRALSCSSSSQQYGSSAIRKTLQP